MADSKITALTSIGASTDPANDPLVLVDVSDTSMAATGTTKKVTLNQLLGASGTATLASATITGDLTVATDALKVNSSTKDICIGTTTPTFNNKLTVVGGAGGDAFITSGNGTRTGYIGTDGTNVIMGAYSNHPLRIHVNDYPQMEVAALGVFNWYDGAGGTRMTLNSTGLGVGGSPTAKLDIFAASGGTVFHGSNSSDSGRGIYMNVANSGVGVGTGMLSTDGSGYSLLFGINGSEKARIDTSGNVGIGVTPSAWQTGTPAVQLKYNSSIWSNSDNTIQINQNAYFDGSSWKYVNATSLQASNYFQYNGSHSWRTAPSGTAGNAITWTQAMTLDASGRLLVGPTSANTSGGILQLSSGITFPATQVASSDANTLDDYEEGTFIATLKGSTTDPTTPVTVTARYTKIGRVVNVIIYFGNVNTTGASGAVQVIGLPFTSASGPFYPGSAVSGDTATFTGTLGAWIAPASTQVDVLASASGGSVTGATHNAGAGRYLALNITYTV